MRTRIYRSPSGQAAYLVRRGDRVLARIQHLSRAEARASGSYYPCAHWALIHASGRVDRFERLDEARDQALKL